MVVYLAVDQSGKGNIIEFYPTEANMLKELRRMGDEEGWWQNHTHQGEVHIFEVKLTARAIKEWMMMVIGHWPYAQYVKKQYSPINFKYAVNQIGFKPVRVYTERQLNRMMP